MISKELLSEVLGDKVEIDNTDSWLKSDNNIVYIETSRKGDITDTNFVNIYELAYKCKEWAFKNHKLIINSRIISKTKDINGYAEIIKSCDYLYGDYADTEVEAILKACQWILDTRQN